MKGEETHLSPKPFDLLMPLVANRARAVSKAGLQQRLWPPTFVEETNLATPAAEIRRAVRDTPADPRFVQTVYGFGYRFVGEVTVDTGSSATVTSRGRLWLTFEGREIPLVEAARTDPPE